MAERLELLIPERRIRARVMALGRQIGAEYSGKKLSLVVVLKGACIFAADLMRQIEIPFTIDFITAASYGESARSSGTVVLSGLDRLDLAGRDVLVIEDILDTGRTSAALRDGLRQHGAARFALCTLLRQQGVACRPGIAAAIMLHSSARALCQFWGVTARSSLGAATARRRNLRVEQTLPGVGMNCGGGLQCRAISRG